MVWFDFSVVTVGVTAGGVRALGDTSVTAVDPQTGGAVQLRQGGVPVQRLTSDMDGLLEFEAEDVPVVRLTMLGNEVLAESVQQKLAKAELGGDIDDAADAAIARAALAGTVLTPDDAAALFVPAAQVGQSAGVAALNGAGEVVDGAGNRVKPRLRSRAVDLVMLPGLLDNVWQYNAVPFVQDNVVTVTGPGGVDVQYAIWWDSQRHPIIGKRAVGSVRWSTFDLHTVAGNPLASPVALDGHNSIVLGVDAAGYLHVAGNMHNHPMRYVRSSAPHSIAGWVSTAPPASGLTQITYPQFVRLSDGRLLLLYRSGQSGGGDVYLERWSGSAWTGRTKVINGIATGESPYLGHVAVGVDDSIHLQVIWRETGNANSNRDLCHLRSLDGGVTWQSQDGAALALPVTHPTCPVVLATAASGSGLLNTSGLDVTPDGAPHMVVHYYGAGPSSQLLHSYWDGGAWVNEVVTDWTYQMPLDVSVVNAEIARPSIFCTSTGRVVIIYRSNRDGQRGAVRLRDVTPGRPVVDAVLVGVDLHAWEPSYDTRAIRNRGELHLLVTPVKPVDSALPENLAGTTSWMRQWGGVLSVDLDHLDQLLAGEAALPRVQVLTTTHLGPTAATFNNGSLAASAIVAPSIPGTWAGWPLLARFSMRVNSQTATASQIALRQRQSGAGVGVDLAVVDVPGSTTLTVFTPWVPLTVDETANQAGQFLEWFTAQSIRVTTLSLEIGVLVHGDGTPVRR